MNVFVLSTGRCGSTTFSKACSHMTNFTAAHESRARVVGEERLDYPEDHIEVDNRLSWFLGQLDERYGNNAYYVHLTRNPTAVGKSYRKRYDLKGSIVRAYREQILLGANRATPARCSKAYVHTVNANIALFLKDKKKVMRIEIEKAAEQFPAFWAWIAAEGDFDAALAEFDIMHNAGPAETGDANHA